MNSNLLKIFNPKCAIHAGLSVDGDIYHYILIAKAEGKKAVILFKRTGQFAAFKQFPSCPMHVNLQNTAALLVHDSLAGTDPEEWIDCNEERIIPKGLSSNEVINEWCVYEDEIYSGTVLKTSLNEALVKLRAGDFMLSSVSIPLWDLAILYGQHIQGFFIIWNIFSKHSIIGYVEKGRLSSVCNFWAGADDVSSTPDEVKEQLLQLARSLSGFEEKVRIVAVNHKSPPESAAIIKSADLESINIPVIANVPPEYHEAYSLAMHEESTLDFAPVDHSMQARAFVDSRKKALSIVRGGIVGLMAVLILLSGIKAAIQITDSYVNRKMEPIKEYLTQYTAQKSRVQSLTGILRLKSGFVAQKSLLTMPVTEMQSAFPEGVWAEEISFSEKDLSSWDVTIIALSASSSLIPELIKKLSNIKGMRDIRMIYSEQTTGSGKNSLWKIKFKLDGVWKK